MSSKPPRHKNLFQTLKLEQKKEQIVNKIEIRILLDIIPQTHLPKHRQPSLGLVLVKEHL